MKKIDDIIRENKDYLNSEEPRKGHFQRFANKLDANKKRKFRPISLKIAKAASIAILIGFSSLWIYDNLIVGKQTKINTLGDISPEFKEIEIYYTNTINLYYDQIEQIEFNEIQKSIILSEFSAGDSIFKSLHEDLKKYPDDKRVINAIISHYKLKVETMEQIIELLTEINNENNTQNESLDI